MESGDTVVSIMSKPQTVQPRNRGSIPGTVKDFSLRQDRLWDPPSVLLSTGEAFAGGKGARA
jgi:hypothetical protein